MEKAGIESGHSSRFERADEDSDPAELLERSLSTTAALEGSAEQTQIERRILRQVGAGGRLFSRTLAAALVAIGISSKDILAQTAEQPQLSQEQMDTVHRIVGMPFPELASRFSIEMPVESPSGTYVVHIGQTHGAAGGGLLNVMFQGTIVRSQVAIEEVLKNMIKEQNLQCVFEEGFTSDDLGDRIKKIVATLTETIDRVAAAPINTFDSFMAASKATNELVASARSNILIRHRVGRPIAELQKSMLDAIQNKTIQLSDDPNTREFQETILSMELAFGSLRGIISLVSDEQSNPYFMGATLKIFMENGVPQICAAEGNEANTNAMTALTERNTARDEYQGLLSPLIREMMASPEVAPLRDRRDAYMAKGDSNLSAEEQDDNEQIIMTLRAKIAEIESSPQLATHRERLENAEREYQRLVMTVREHEVLRQIARRDEESRAGGQNMPQNIAVVYGSAHNFTNVVLRWNNDNPHLIQRGLIKVTPK